MADFVNEEIDSIAKLREHQILFIGGFMGEFLSLPLIGTYFKSNIEALRTNFGIEEIDTIMPSSLKTIWDNAEKIKERIFQNYFQSNKPVIAFAHSRAGAEILLATLRYPELIYSGVLSKIVIFQGCLNGSVLADRLTNYKRNSKKSPLKAVQILASKFDFLECMQQDFYADYYAQRFNELDDKFKNMLNSRLLVILGAKENTRDTMSYLQVSHLLLKNLSGENDGILDISSQTFDHIEEASHIRVEADHGELVTSFPFSQTDNKSRHEFTQMIFNHLMQ